MAGTDTHNRTHTVQVHGFVLDGGKGKESRFVFGRDPRCSPRGNPACRGTFGGRRKGLKAWARPVGGLGEGGGALQDTDPSLFEGPPGYRV